MSKPSTVTALYDGGDRLQIRVPGHELWADQPLDEGRSHRRDTDGGLHRENLQLSLVHRAAWRAVSPSMRSDSCAATASSLTG